MPSLAVGRFVAPPGHEDSQDPHSEDEIYFVTAGEAHLILDNRTHPVQAGSVVYVPAGTAHRFTNIRVRIDVLVFFAPCPPRA